MEVPRAKLRDTFTSSTDAESDADRQEPIISERSQALREIIRIHEQGNNHKLFPSSSLINSIYNK